jgi:uncharacterized membrane protein YqgA involved in biofilm formation
VIRATLISVFVLSILVYFVLIIVNLLIGVILGSFHSVLQAINHLGDKTETATRWSLSALDIPRIILVARLAQVTGACSANEHDPATAIQGGESAINGGSLRC